MDGRVATRKPRRGGLPPIPGALSEWLMVPGPNPGGEQSFGGSNPPRSVAHQTPERKRRPPELGRGLKNNHLGIVSQRELGYYFS